MVKEQPRFYPTFEAVKQVLDAYCLNYSVIKLTSSSENNDRNFCEIILELSKEDKNNEHTQT